MPCAPRSDHVLSRAARGVLPAALALLLAACGEQALYSQLSERQANDMVAALQGAGIPASKQSQDGRFSVLTDSARFPDAMRTLNAKGLPRESFDTMGKVFKKDGMVSSPVEERARLLHAMSQEIASTLANIDGVVVARVHLALPEKHPLMDKLRPASAAVFIKHRPDKDLTDQTTAIKGLVVKSIEGLAYDDVTVALFPAEGLATELSPRAVGGRAAAAAAEGPGLQAASLVLPLGLGALAGTLAVGGGGLLWWRRRAPARARAHPTAAALAAPRSPGTPPGC